jgi:hypothetical protein
MEGCMPSDANYAPLTPVSFLERAAVVYGDRTAVVSGGREYSWRETRERCLAGASALARLGVGRRDVVSDRPELDASMSFVLGANSALNKTWVNCWSGRRHRSEHSGDVRAALQRADGRRRALHAEHPARRGHGVRPSQTFGGQGFPRRIAVPRRRPRRPEAARRC